jgi:hypothetical protein
MGKVLSDVLGTLSASDSDDAVTPLNASGVVFIDSLRQGSGFGQNFHASQEISEINHLNSRRGC